MAVGVCARHYGAFFHFSVISSRDRLRASTGGMNPQTPKCDTRAKCQTQVIHCGIVSHLTTRPNTCPNDWHSDLKLFFRVSQRNPRSWRQWLPGNNRLFLQYTGLSSFSSAQEWVLWHRGLHSSSPQSTKLPNKQKPTCNVQVRGSQELLSSFTSRTQHIKSQAPSDSQYRRL